MNRILCAALILVCSILCPVLSFADVWNGIEWNMGIKQIETKTKLKFDGPRTVDPSTYDNTVRFAYDSKIDMAGKKFTVTVLFSNDTIKEILVYYRENNDSYTHKKILDGLISKYGSPVNTEEKPNSRGGSRKTISWVTKETHIKFFYSHVLEPGGGALDIINLSYTPRASGKAMPL